MLKRVSISLLIALSSSGVFAQGWVNNGANVVLTDSVHVVVTTVNGHYLNKSNGLIRSKRESYFHIRGNWINNGGNEAVASNNGTVILDGAVQQILGTNSSSFNNLWLTGTGDKYLGIETLVGGGQLGIKSGQLDLTNKRLYLNTNTLIVNNEKNDAIQRSNGIIVGETNPIVGYSFVQWNFRDQPFGNQYEIPFGSTDDIYIPFLFNIDQDGVSSLDSGHLKVAMYPTNPLVALNNRPLPAGVTNLDNEYGIENDIKSLDRFYVVQSGGFGFQPQLSLTFPYIDREWDQLAGSLNDIVEDDLVAVRYNSGNNQWNYDGSGTADAGNNNVSSSAGSSFAGNWVLYNISPCPVASLEFDEVCFGEQMEFRNTSTIDRGLITEVEWDLEGAAYSGQDTVQHLFPNDGTQNIRLIVTSDRGCKDTAITTIEVHPLPVIDFGYTDTCLGMPTIFTSRSTTRTGTPMLHQWKSPGMTPGSGAQFAHVFPSIGMFTMTHISTNSWGCIDSASKDFNVRETPPVEFFTREICEGEVVNFVDQTGGAAALRSWTWKVGEEIISYSDSTSRRFSFAGTYPITLVLENEYGCIDSFVQPQLVKPKAIADFTFWPDRVLISDPIVRFFDNSTNANIYDWDFGDGVGRSNLMNPEYTYADTGAYSVLLIADNDGQCPDTVRKTIVIGPDLKIFIPNAFTPQGLDNLNETFKPSGILQGMRDFHMQIYNRWGEMLFESFSIDNPWDGTYRGVEVEMGNYLYLIRVVDHQRNEHFFKGMVMLLR